MPRGRLDRIVRSATALIVAICFIFGAAMVAEFSGIVPREVTTAPVDTVDATPGPSNDDAAGTPDADSSASPDAEDGEAFQADAPEWADLRIGVIGGFLVACIFILMRASGDFL